MKQAKNAYRRMHAVALLLAMILVGTAAVQPCVAHASVVGTSTGTEASNYTIRRPGATVFDASGNLYVADTGNHRILRIDLTGVVYLVAGTGEQGYSGDGGAATSALLDSPAGIALDSTGNLYIADTHNHCIRMVSGSTITTVAGTGVAGYSGDGLTATASKLSLPTALAVDASNNLYIADTSNHRVRVLSGGLLNTAAGTGVQGFDGDGGAATSAQIDSPAGIAIDSSGNLYISDTHNQRIRMVAQATGLIGTVAGTGAKGFTSDGTATASPLARPRGLAVDSAGNLVIADSDNQRIRTLSSGQLATLAGSGVQGFSGDAGTATSARLDSPRAVAVQTDSAAIADTGNNAIRSYADSGLNTVAGTPTMGSESLTFSGPITVTYGSGTLTATFANGGNTATSSISLYKGLGASPVLVNSATLSSNMASFSTSALGVGTHYLTAYYAGDTNNPAIVSRTYVLTVTSAALTAVANAATMHYGESVPSLTGTLNGVPSQDTGNVSAVYTTTATSSSAPGVYAITASLSGSAAGNYTVSMGTGSGSLTVSAASSSAVLSVSKSTPAYGESVQLTATVASATSGTPTGTVNFYSGSTLLNSTPVALSSGSASFSISTLPIGSSSLKVVYNGNTNFDSATSAVQTVTVSAPVIVSSVSALSFGSQTVGAASALQTVVLSNPNGSSVTVSSITVTGDYAASSNCPTIAANSNCTIGITFTPTAQGTRTGTLTVVIAESSAPLSVSLTGTGAAAGILVTPASLDFGSQVVATTSYGQPVSIQNTGNADLIVSNIATTGDFTTAGNCSTIPAGSTCSLTVTFTPTATGTRTGVITLTDNAGSSAQTQTIALTGVGTQAGATLLPAKQSFPDTMVGSSSLAQIVTLTNTGTASLTGISAAIQGDFSQTNTCSATLAASASCTFSIVFTPTLSGAESGKLTVTNNLGTQTVALSGTGTVPGVSLSTAQLLFGSQLTGTTSQAQTVVLTNTGTAAATISSVTLTGQFIQTTDCSGQVAAGGSCSVNVIFAPTTVGQQTGTLTITSNAGSGTQTVALQGQGTAVGLSIAPSFVSFGSQPVNTTSLAQTLVATNTGTAPITLATATVSTNFTESDLCAGVMLQPAATCTISVSFAPKSTGSLQGSLVMGNTAGTISSMVTLSGQGTLPGVGNSPSRLHFGSLPVGSASREQTVTITNTGTASLKIGTVVSTGDFDETDNCAGQTLAANAYCVISVTMTPTSIGTRTGQIRFTNNADGLHIISLSGVGQQAGVVLSPTSLSFGGTPLGSSSSALSVNVRNTGSAALQLSSIIATSDFVASNNCGSSLAVGSSCTVQVTFAPTAAGHRTGTLTFTDNAASGTQVVSLEGYGSPAGLILSPSVLNFGVQKLNVASAVQIVTLTNQTGKTLNNLSITASGEYYVTHNCPVTLSSGSNCTLRIWVVPVLRGAITGTINISYTTSTSSSSSAHSSVQAMVDSSDGSSFGVISLLTSASDTSNSPSQLAFTVAPAASVLVGGNAGAFITVQENDSSGNPTSATDTLTLSVAGPSSYAKSYTATASGGLAVFDLSGVALTTPGSYTYTASFTGLQPATASETVAYASTQPTVTLTASSNAIFLKSSVTYTATVAGSSTTPTGTVTFLDGTTELGTVTLSSGVATLTATPAATGTHSITALYSGQTGLYASTTSSAQSVLVQDFTIASSNASSMSIGAGQTAIFNFAVTPASGSTMPAAITFTVSGAPSDASVQIAPATVASGSGTTNVAVYVTPASKSAALHPRQQNGSGHSKWPLAVAVLLLPFAILRRGRRLFCVLLLLVGGLAASASLSGCGIFSGNSTQSTGSYTITVTGTSGSLTHTATVTLTVQ